MRIQFKDVVFWAASACASLCLGGCASIAHGTRQDIVLNSTPASVVKVDGEIKGVTPVTVALRRGTVTHSVSFEKPGCDPAQAVIEQRFSSWYIGDILLLSPLGLVLDAANGAMWRLVPERVDATLVCPVAASPLPSGPADKENLLIPG
jgi:hypothetical protein